MKSTGLFSLVVVLAFLAATMQPEVVPEVHAAVAIAAPDLVPTCKDADCLAGWQKAYQHAINDETECRQATSGPEEESGCRAFVQAVLQDRLENQW